jgi:predicted nucleic acid-binding Zn ribbon protein
VDNLFATRGWDTNVKQARIFSDWTGLVGQEIAEHSTPTSLAEGKLHISAESTAWATQLRMMNSQIMARLVKELGPTIVTGLHITGPVAPSWKRGGWSIRGRGPRDTYG